MAKHDKRPKFRHLNTPLHLRAPPWQASLHKLPMVVGKKICHTILPWPLVKNTQSDTSYLQTNVANFYLSKDKIDWVVISV